MIEKIVSGGQTGADQGALEAAIRLGIAHGGWIPSGRKTEDGRLPEKYHLQEMPSGGYPERTEQNVRDSDGTVILSHGRLTGGSKYTREMAIRHGRPWIHIDLDLTGQFHAAVVMSKWVRDNHIGVLNVAGPRASHDPTIYGATLKIVESACLLLQIGIASDAASGRPPSENPARPETVHDAVAMLTERLTLKDKALIANMTESELGSLNRTIGDYIRRAFDLPSGNAALMASCSFVSKSNVSDDMAASQVIITALWAALRKTHRLRVVE